MKNIKNIQFGKLGMIAAIAFMATSCQQDEVLDQYDPKPQGEMISFHIQRGWDFDKISRSTGTQYGEHISDNNLVSEDNSESMKMGVYQQPIGSWFGEANSRGTMIQSADFSEFLAFGYKTKTENGTATTTPIFVSSYHDIENNTTNNTDDAGWEKPVGTGENANGYYWPGSDYTCSFFGISMSDGKLTDTTSGTSVYNNVTTKTNTAGQIIGFDYTVPALAVNQPDIMVAAANNIPGDGSSSVSLDFKHILTAVNVKVGVKTGETTMPEGTIQSITFKNVYGKGNYNIVNGSWSGMREANDIRNFSVNLGSGFNTDNISQTTPVTTGTATFMMIPQTLPNDAEIEVVFKHKIGTTSTISASLSGMSWPMGIEINYLISISPEGELKFTSTIPVVDAHYVIVPFKITNNISTSNKTWRLTAYDNNGNDIGIYLRTELSTLQSQGYWTYNEFGSDDGKEITRDTPGEVQVYAFIPENNSTTNRNLKLTLYAGSSTTAAATMSLTQLGMNEANGERIEETGYVPWGFKWDSTTRIVYTFKYDFWKRAFATVYSWFSNSLFNVAVQWEGFSPKTFTVTINLGSISTSSIGVESESDGLTNSKTIYNYQGISTVADLKNSLDNWCLNDAGEITSGQWPMNPSEFAARNCVMKNKFKKVTTNNDGTEVPTAEIETDNFVWYLPAKNEYTTLEEKEVNEYKLEGVYWTSTAPQDNASQAYQYTAGGTGASLEDRATYNKVRCMRTKPTATTNN